MKRLWIKSEYNTLIPLPQESRFFEYDENACFYSQEALDYIQLLLSEGRSFHVRTSDTCEIEKRREEIVWGNQS